MWDDTALIKAYDKAVASFKVRGGAGGPPCSPGARRGAGAHGRALPVPQERPEEWGVRPARGQAGAAPGDEEEEQEEQEQKEEQRGAGDTGPPARWARRQDPKRAASTSKVAPRGGRAVRAPQTSRTATRCSGWDKKRGGKRLLSHQSLLYLFTCLPPFCCSGKLVTAVTRFGPRTATCTWQLSSP